MTTLTMADYTPPTPAFGTWTLVADLLPAACEDVLVVVPSTLDDEPRTEFAWIDGRGVWHDTDGNPLVAPPTHWMPQPPLPGAGQ